MTRPEINPLSKDNFLKLTDMSKAISEFKMPSIDMNAMLETQHKNIEAITTINQTAFNNLQSFLLRQADLMRKGLEQTGNMITEMMTASTAQEKVIYQAQSSKIALEQCLENVRDASETLAKCNGLVMQTVSNRMSEGLDELRVMIKTDLAA